MQAASYRPILPDEATTAEICSGNRPGFPEHTKLPHHHPSQIPHTQPPAKPAPTGSKIPVILSNNKDLIIGLIVIVVILIIIIVIQIMRSRKKNEEDEENAKILHVPPPSPNVVHTSTDTASNINDKLLKQYMKKKPTGLRQQMSSMASYVTGRKEKDDDVHMSTIIEESASVPDKEQESMRSNINTILREQLDDDGVLQDGAKSVVEAENIVYTEMQHQQNKFRHNVRDEALLDQNEDGDDANVSGGARIIEIDNDDDGDDDEIEFGTCNFILLSGKRTGQLCGRKSTDAANKCVRHHNK